MLLVVLAVLVGAVHSRGRLGDADPLSQLQAMDFDGGEESGLQGAEVPLDGADDQDNSFSMSSLGPHLGSRHGGGRRGRRRRKRETPRFHDRMMHGDDGSILGDSFPSADSFPGPHSRGLGLAEQHSVMDSERQAEQAEREAMKLLERKKRHCHSHRCRQRIERRERRLLKKSESRQRAIAQVLRPGDQKFTAKIQLRIPEQHCNFEATTALQRRDFPELGQLSQTHWRRIRKWIHHIARIQG